MNRTKMVQAKPQFKRHREHQQGMRRGEAITKRDCFAPSHKSIADARNGDIKLLTVLLKSLRVLFPPVGRNRTFWFKALKLLK